MAETSRPRRVLVISNETVEADILRDTLVAHADATEVVVVAPALNTRFRHWLSDEDPARHAAQRRVDGCLAALTRAGVRVDGWVGDADPLQAIADALHGFPADELVIATHPPRRSHWLSRDVVARARGRFGLPVLHVAVETESTMPIAA